MPASDDDDRPRDRRSRRDRYDEDDRPRRRDEDDDDGYDRPPAPQSNGLATAGLILGVLAFFTLGLTTVPGVICSAIAMGKPAKRGAAVAGLVLSLFGGLVSVILLIALLLPATHKVREAAARMKDQNNLKQLALGGYNHESAYGKLPTADGQLSWRVHMLPFIEQESTYRQFNLNEPWDGPTNKPLAGRQINTFVSPSEVAPGPDTRYRVFVGPNTVFRPGKPPLRFTEITDGTSNTFYIVEAGDTVPWPQPKELNYDRAGPLPPLGHSFRNGFNVAFADGSVRFIKSGVSEAALRAGIEPTDGKPFIE